MERKVRTVEMTFEENEVVIYHRRRVKQTLSWCAQCDQRTSFAEPAAAARIALINIRIIYQRIEAGSVHFIESPGGDLLVCIDSLTKEPYE